MLVRYAIERLLFRISQSHYANQFLLKGALLFTLWYDMPHGPIRDADLLGFGDSDLESIKKYFVKSQVSRQKMAFTSTRNLSLWRTFAKKLDTRGYEY